MKALKAIFPALLLVVGATSSFAGPFSSRKIDDLAGLVRINDVDRAIVCDLRYATENNFTGKKVYPVAVGVLRKETALKLAAANAEFLLHGCRLKVWDGYRPPSVQKIFWSLVPDERYVANPDKGWSRHNRGGAVDVTLVDDDGQELAMPSGFDDFSERADPKSIFISAEAKLNSALLVQVMERYGFVQDEHEWWHFDDPDWENYPLVDVPFEKFLQNPIPPPEASVMFQPLPPDVKQALRVEEIPGTKEFQLTFWERGRNGWSRVLLPMPAVAGRNGLAALGTKKEGDGKTPSGTFVLGTAFGYAPAVETKLAFRQATGSDFWVDDPRSLQYNQWVNGTPQAKSFERMKREDDLYKYGVVIEYNTDPIISGAGSAIFLHIWRKPAADKDGGRHAPAEPTAGCVATSEANLLSLLKRLNKDKHPVIVIEKLLD